MENIIKIQEKIDEMEYWDAKILDFRCLYFGDSIEIFIEDDKEFLFKMTLKQCFNVSYNNLYTIDSDTEVQDMNAKQLGYFAQDITVEKSEQESCYKISLDLPMLFCIAECKDIIIEHIKKEGIKFFWIDN